MSTTTFVLVLLVAFVGTWVAWDTARAVRIWTRLRGGRVVTCPETGRPAGVQIDVGHAVATGLVEHAPAIRLSSCARWPERGRGQEPCIDEAQDPGRSAAALVSRALTGKPCVYCGQPIANPSFLDHYAALRRKDGTTGEWPDGATAELPAALADGEPVCWNCHVAETFRRTYPELVTDRPWRRA